MTTSSGATGRDASTRLTVAMLWLLIGVFVLYPLCRLLAMTFWGEHGFTFENLKPFVSSWYDQQAAVNSILLGFSVGLAGTILGFIFAFAVTRLQMPSWAKFIIGAITILPLISPPFTSSIALTLLLGPNGMILTLLGIEDFNFYGFWGTFISETLTFYPVAFMTLSTILSRIDPNLEDAAYSLGASSLTVFRTVTMPLAVPGIANAFLLVFSCSLADFATPQVLGGHSFPVLPTQAYLQITGMYDFKGGAALSFMLLIPALIVYLLQHYWVSRKNFVTVSGKAGGRSSIHGPGLLVTTVMSVVIASVIALIIAIYSVIVLGSVVKVWGVDNSITFANYEYDGYTVGNKGLLYCFGHGLSYTSFGYSDMQIDSVHTQTGNVTVYCTVTNTGDVAGDEVVQMYINDVISSTTTYEKNLRGFERIHLEPGESKTVHFPIVAEDLILINADGEKVVEPGEFRVMVGSSYEDIRLQDSFFYRSSDHKSIQRNAAGKDKIMHDLDFPTE